MISGRRRHTIFTSDWRSDVCSSDLHRPETLAEWLGSGHFATVLFHLSPVQPFAGTDLLPIARTLGVGSLAMRPIGSGLLADFESALRYVRGYHPDVIVSGLTTPERLEEHTSELQSLVNIVGRLLLEQ